MLAGYNLRQIPHHFGVQPKTDPLRCDMLRRFLFAHICRNSLFIICSLQNSSYCLLSTISGIFTINALLQQPCVPFHFDKQASFATSTPTNFCLQNHKWPFSQMLAVSHSTHQFHLLPLPANSHQREKLMKLDPCTCHSV